MRNLFKLFLIGILVFSTNLFAADKNDWLVGAGIYDITGPIVETVFFGMSDDRQIGEGLQSRLFSRAFVIAQKDKSQNRVVIVNTDLGMISQAVQQQVVENLQKKYGKLYSEKNVMLLANHTHSGPGGFSHYFIYDLAIGGFEPKNFEIIVQGIVKSIEIAHKNLQPASIKLARGDIYNCGWNRSPIAYEKNPEIEKEKYGLDDKSFTGFISDGKRWNNTNKKMTLLKFVGTNGEDIGLLNWFAVHPTSMGAESKLVSSDNKGYAEYLCEKEKKGNHLKAKTFIAAFAQETCGDVSPQILWGNPAKRTVKLDFKNMKILGYLQYQKASELYKNAQENIGNKLNYRHLFVDFSSVKLPNGHRTWPAAAGLSQWAGSSECSVLAFNPYTEGVTRDLLKNPLTNREKVKNEYINDFTTSLLGSTVGKGVTDQKFVNGHAEKPIMYSGGLIKFNGVQISPQILPVQLFRIGKLAILALPVEVTTMSGRRLRETVLNILKKDGVEYAVIAANANAYSSYLTTREEYSAQHYEGASTFFGPHELEAFQYQFSRLAKSMLNKTKIESTVKPLDLRGKIKVVNKKYTDYDSFPLGAGFAKTQKDADLFYRVGDTVKVVFWGANPRRDYFNQKSYFTIEKKEGTKWVPFYYDWDFNTRLKWKAKYDRKSLIAIEWDIDKNQPGQYRICYECCAQYADGVKKYYKGYSKVFTVLKRR